MDEELCDTRYQIFRTDRNYAACNKKEGGGVLIAVKNEICSNIIVIRYNATFYEDIWLELRFAQTKTIICCVYVPEPTHGNLVDFLQFQQDIVNTNESANILTVGDFNLPSLFDSTGRIVVSSNTHQLFCDFVNASNLNQYNLISNSSHNILDLVLCNSDVNVINSLNVLSKINIYHPPLEINIYIKVNKIKHKFQTRYNLKKQIGISLLKYFKMWNGTLHYFLITLTT